MQTLPLQEGRKQDLIAFSLYFQKIMAQKIPPGGEGLPYWPLAYKPVCHGGTKVRYRYPRSITIISTFYYGLLRAVAVSCVLTKA